MLKNKLTILNYCWVCNKEFNVNCKKEDHHVVPRAYGGVDGPQVSLCDSHHSAVHEIALKLWTRRSYHTLLTTDNGSNQKLLWLASVAYNARLATENDVNKRKIIIFSPTKDTLDKLDKLKTLYKNRLSRQTLIESAITSLYNSHFIK